MRIGKLKGQVKEITGRITGDKGLEVEGKIEQGAADAIKAVGEAASVFTDKAGALINSILEAVNNLYEGVKNWSRKVFLTRRHSR